ncbi:YifB family Mg chelatase-like AAA ATPase [Candidatus Riflebacteria bacterium]
MVAKIFGVIPLGVQGILTEIEVYVSGGLPALNIVGLGDTAVMESRERVRAAIKNCGFKFPSQRITVNLAPAAIKKEGPGLDLAIAIGILLATDQIQLHAELKEKAVFFGELSLDGKVKYSFGNLQAAKCAFLKGFAHFFTHYEGCLEAANIPGIACYAVNTLRELTMKLADVSNFKPTSPIPEKKETVQYPLNFGKIKGQHAAKRALEIAAAGGHNVLLCGTPGCGKTLLSRAFPSILPEMTLQEKIDVTEIYSAKGILDCCGQLVRVRPFRAPHHSVSDAALIGGGQIPRPGEVTLSHHGVLFLDELPEFKKNILELLRQPLSDGIVQISRARMTMKYPAQFILLSAMNPCPCGFFGDKKRICVCSPNLIQKYLGKISGPILDRIDMVIHVPRVETELLLKEVIEESSEKIRARVNNARKIQTLRLKGLTNPTNSQILSSNLPGYIALDGAQQNILKMAIDHYQLSARAFDKILKLTLTIMDLEGATQVKNSHLLEAIKLRTWNPGQSLAA